jgi:5'-nucleotidase
METWKNEEDRDLISRFSDDIHCAGGFGVVFSRPVGERYPGGPDPRHQRSARPAGTAEYLATHIKGLKATNPDTILVSAGDNIGASPLISALFHDEPTIKALSMMGFDYSAAGNHEFDEGACELLRMQYGCCHPTTGCQGGERFVGAGFRYLTANVINETTNETLFPPYDIRSVQGVPVAFIGVSLKSTPAIVVPSGVEGLKFIDEADAINGCVEVLKEQGVETMVVLVHNGGLSTGLPDEGMGPCEPVEDIVKRTDDEVDLFITGHSHQAYITTIDGRLVTQARCQGKFITDIDLIISPMTRDVVEVRAKNVAVTRDVPKDQAISELLEKYADLMGPLANEVVGSITADIMRNATGSGESALGDLIADAQLYATSCNESAVVAFMNPGGIRTNILFDKTTGDELPGEVTYQEAFDVQPFDNSLIVMNLTGLQIDSILEVQFDNPSQGQNRMLQVSCGFTYAWSESAPPGSRVDMAAIKINGTPIDPDGTYRVAANCFLAEGGDGFIAFKEGVDRTCGISDLDALVNYLRAFSPVSPTSIDRISVVKEASCELPAQMAPA